MVDLAGLSKLHRMNDCEANLMRTHWPILCLTQFLSGLDSAAQIEQHQLSFVVIWFYLYVV